MAFLAVFVALKIAHRAGGYAGWAWFPTECDLRRPEYHLVELKKNPLQRIFEAKKLGSRVLEFGMTQSFSGQMDGTSATQMARNPQNRGLLGFGDLLLKKLRPRT